MKLMKWSPSSEQWLTSNLAQSDTVQDLCNISGVGAFDHLFSTFESSPPTGSI